MRTKFLLVAAVAAVASLALVPAAGAKSSYIKVTNNISFVDLCRPTTEQIGFRFQFKAKIVRRNAKKPKSVRVEYSVTDAATGAVYSKGKSTLTPRNKYTNKTPTILIPAGATVTYSVISVYNSSGRRVSSKSKTSETWPTAAQLDTLQTPLPAVCS